MNATEAPSSLRDEEQGESSDSFDGYSPSAQVEAFEMTGNNNNFNTPTMSRPKRRFECWACWVYFALCLVLSHAVPPIDLYERPIPVQYLETTGDYIRNQIYDQPIPDPETVSTTYLVLMCGVAPVALQLLLSFCLPITKRVVDRHCTICVYLVGIGTNVLATDSIKLYCGYLRPIFYAVCQPDATYTSCTATDQGEIDDARKSFPSGHASLAFHGMLLFSLYLQQTWGVGRRDGGDTSSSARAASVLSLLPMALAGWIAATRVQDNKHFPVDVAAGSVLGGTLAYFAHHLWFGRASNPEGVI